MKYQVSPEKKIGSGLFGMKAVKGIMAMMFMAMSILSFGQNPEIRKAFRLIDSEQPKKGLAALEQQAGSSSSNQYYLGLAYLRTGNKEKALAAFEKGISMNEKDGLNYAGKGHVKLLEKNSTEAKTNFDKALAVSKSKDANVLRAVAEGYLSDSKYVLDAINLLNKAKSMNAADPEINMLLGDAYLMQNNGGESVSSYERAARTDAQYGKPNYKIAKVYQRSKNFDMVLEYLNKAITADPQFAPAYKELGEVYYTKKEPAKAVEAIEKYLAITEDPGQAKFQAAFYYLMNKQFEKANQIFKEVINSPNASATALKYYAMSLFEQKKFDEARTVFETYFQKAKPEEVTASDFGMYGKTLIELKEDSLANIAFVQSLGLDSAQQDVLQLHGTALLKRKKYEEAVPVFKQLIAIRKQPLSQDLWSIGQAYYFNEQYMEADTAFSQLAEKQPKVTHGWLWSGRARANIDSTMTTGLAKPQYDKFLEIALENPEKNKKDIIEAYEYLGAYYIHKEKNVNQAKTYYEKILQLDPNNSQAQEFIRTINSPANPQKGGKK
jgi:tetratricopeptide (TPR) repeat protein